MDTYNRLQRMLPLAKAMLMEKFHRRMNAVTDQINKGQVPQELLRKYCFDPVRVFGNEAGVRAVLAGAAAGTASLWSRE